MISPLASGLSTAWIEIQTRTKREAKVAGKQRAHHAIDDAAALSTRPNYPPSPEKFNRDAVDRALANASHSENEMVTKRKNMVHFTKILCYYLDAECAHV